MGKVQILAVLTMDGCLSSELYDKAHQGFSQVTSGISWINQQCFIPNILHDIAK